MDKGWAGYMFKKFLGTKYTNKMATQLANMAKHNKAIRSEKTVSFNLYLILAIKLLRLGGGGGSLP